MAKLKIRLVAVQVSFALGIGLILARAAQVQIVEGKQHAQTSRANRTVEVEMPAPRGPIYDRDSRPLAMTQEVFTVSIAPNEVRDTAETIGLLSRQLGIPKRAVRREFLRKWVQFRGRYSAADVQPLRRRNGVHLDGSLERFYPNGDLARPVLGRPALEGRAASGLERVLDTLLIGVPGSGVRLRDRSGTTYESPSRLDAFPTMGHQIYLTLHIELQEIVEDALAAAVENLGAIGGDVVVLDPSTGEVLAMASYGAETGATVGGIVSAFEPGSTAKVFALGALLAGDLWTPGESVYTEGGRYEMEYRVVEDDHPEAEHLTLPQVIKHSSNIGIVKFASRLSPNRQFDMLRKFGLGTRTGIEFPVESQGTLKPPYRWSGTTAAALAMGYEVAVTPLQLTLAYAVIANDGLLMRPTFVREIRDPDGRTVYRHEPEPVRRVIAPEHARTIRGMLEQVVVSGGTGETAALSSYEIAGKTGTTKRVAPNGGYLEGSYTASFASIFPADDPQIVMVVKLDDPDQGYARLTAAPVTKEVLERLLSLHSSVLDQGRLAVAPPPVSVEPRRRDLGPPTIVPWPRHPTPVSDTVRVVPDVSGMPLREAIRALHESGFYATVDGWGVVTRTVPEAGVVESRGRIVTLVAERKDR